MNEDHLVLSNWTGIHNIFITDLDDFHRISMIHNFSIKISVEKNCTGNEYYTI